MAGTTDRIGTVKFAARLLPAVLLSGGVLLAGAPGQKSIAVTPIGVYRTALFDQGAAEIAAYDRATRRVFVTNVFHQRVDVLDISDPTNPTFLMGLDVTPYGDHANSVAADDGLVAVAVQADVKTDPGKVVFFDAYGTPLAAVTVGALPDMLTFTPDGRRVLVANEGEPNDAYTVDPEGSVSIIDLCPNRRGGRDDRGRREDHGEDSHGERGQRCRPWRHEPGFITDDDVTTVGFAKFNNTVLDASVRIFGPGASVAQDLEPEYIAVSADSRTAWVTLQENNAVAIIDIDRRKVTRIVGLGFKDHSQAGQGLDPSDQDNANSIQTWPVWGMYQPDAIAAFEHKGRTYLVTANEGDVREYSGLPGGTEAKRVGSGSVVLDPVAFPNAAALKNSAQLGRLNITVANGLNAAGTAFERLFSFGARSFSILDADGKQVFDSGDALEQLTKNRYPNNFNASNTNQTRDNRSDDKGPEPEGVTIAKLFGRTYMFLCLERIGGIVIYELDDPKAPTFVDYVNVRDFTAGIDTAAAEDLGPEGLLIVPADDSPTKKPLMIVANEISGTTRIYEITQIKK